MSKTSGYDLQLQEISEIMESGPQPTEDKPGPHIRSAFAALDELIALANNPDTAEQVCAERVLIGTLLARAMLLASFVKEREAGRVHRIGAGR